jgi:hypothetical protein
LASELGSRPRGFESRILRQAAIVSFGSGRQDAAALDRDTVRAFLFDVLQTLQAQASARGYDRGVTGPEPLPDYVLRNRAYWDEVNAQRFAEPGRHAWASDEFTWGIFHVPESVLDLIEVRAPEGAHSPEDLVDPGWARRYPAEQLWRAKKRSAR